jgi:pimeloyl-ACP methyl ester carboxylesterase
MMTPPKAAAIVAKQIAVAKFVSFEGVGHAMMQEAPGDVLDALKDFIKLPNL